MIKYIYWEMKWYLLDLNILIDLNKVKPVLIFNIWYVIVFLKIDVRHS